MRTRRGILTTIVVLRLTSPLWLLIHVDLHFLFWPKTLSPSAWTAGPGRARLSFEPEPGVTVRGYDVTQPQPAAYVLFFYGNGDQMYRDLPFLTWMRGATQSDVRVFDYRGSGYSDGTLSEAHLWHDALAEFDQMAATARAAHRPTIVYGYSLGSALATYVATERRPDGVVLHSAPSDIDREADYAPRKFGPLIAITGARPWIDADAREVIDNASRVRQIDEPLLVMHGTADTFVPYEGGRALYDASPSHDKRFVPLPGLDHTGWIPPTAGGRAVVAFVKHVAALGRAGESRSARGGF